MSYAMCFKGTRGLPFFESEANVFPYQVAADANAPQGLAGECDVVPLVDVPTTGFDGLDKSRPTLMRLSIAITNGAVAFPIVFQGRLPPFIYDARIVCFSDADLVTYAGNLINCPNQQIVAVLGAPRPAIALGNDGFNHDWTEVADASEDPTVTFAVYSTNVLIVPDEHNISGGLYIVMNARDGNAADDELRSAFNIIPTKSAIDYVCI